MLRRLLKRLAPPCDTPSDAADRLISQGRKLEDAGDLQNACKRYREAVTLAPKHVPAHLNLGVGLESAGDTDGALQSYEAVLEIEPGNALANYNLGKLHFQRSALPEAERYLRAALEGKPEFAEAEVVLAYVLDARGDFAGAAAGFAQVMPRRPADFGGWLRYGEVLLKLKREAEAESPLKHALSLDPGNVDVHGTLADLYHSRGDFASAAWHLKAVIGQKPDSPEALFRYAHAMMRLYRFDEADAALQGAIALAPEREFLYMARVDLLHRGGRVEQALELCRARRAQAPGLGDYDSTELFALNFVDRFSAEEVFAQHKAFGERLEKAVTPRFPSSGHDRNPERRLRIGYVSGEFYLHPVARFMVPLIEAHDRSRFEVACYSTGAVADSYTARLKAATDLWRDVRTMKDGELAEQVRRDHIDLLVDLSGHSGGGGRLAMFAEQPAPVQATWLGNLNTTGLTRIHYRITDRHCDPPGLTEHLHTEELVRLSHCQWCYRPFVSTEGAHAAPLERGAGVTFGSFTQISKLTASMRTLWARILRQVRDARLVIAGVPEGSIRDDLLQAFARDGVRSARITLLPFRSLQDYMRSFGDIDICLDTSPYSGGTTTCDALWMGVPVLTLPGVRPASRSAASILATLDLGAWIASSTEDYADRAARFASDPETVREMHRSLRERMRASPLMQEARFARDLERTYRAMWRKWCSGECA